MREGLFSISRAMVLNMAVILWAVRHASLSAGLGEDHQGCFDAEGMAVVGAEPGLQHSGIESGGGDEPGDLDGFRVDEQVLVGCGASTASLDDDGSPDASDRAFAGPLHD